MTYGADAMSRQFDEYAPRDRLRPRREEWAADFRHTEDSQPVRHTLPPSIRSMSRMSSEGARHLVALQRTAGNRAVAHLMAARTRTADPTVMQRSQVQERGDRREGPTDGADLSVQRVDSGIRSSFIYCRDPKEIAIKAARVYRKKLFPFLSSVFLTVKDADSTRVEFIDGFILYVGLGPTIGPAVGSIGEASVEHETATTRTGCAYDVTCYPSSIILVEKSCSPSTTSTPTPAPGVKPKPGSPPTLSKITVPGGGPTTGPRGEHCWIVQWRLSWDSPHGGWIIQRLDVIGAISKADGTPVPTHVDGMEPYWEAWQVNPNAYVTTTAEVGDVKDDTYDDKSYEPKTKGTVAIRGASEFYEGLTLPSSFKVDRTKPSGDAPFTNSDPGRLKGGTGKIDHDLTTAWDATGGDDTTTITRQL
jgi:hypothetical protein